MSGNIDVATFVKALSIPTDETYRGDCPVCHRKNTFNVTSTLGRLLYNCYHADCTVGGTTKTGHLIQASSRTKNQTPQKVDLSVYNKQWVGLDRSQRVVDYLKSVQAYHAYKNRFANIRYDVKEDRCVFLVYKDKTLVDAVGRSLTNSKPKWKRYASSRVPFVTANDSSYLVIVEDCASACALTISGVRGMALMGTNLLTEYLKYCKGYKLVTVALDKDASKKAMKMVHELSIHVRTKLKLIDKDIKTWTTEKIIGEFNE
jgi:hypothetical protein|tara:strand:- start:2900 stop:3679 length:780 start_codon:yes stop_codon:yes gene_type:complete